MCAARMTSLERVRTVLDGRIPDRVPVCLLGFPNTAQLAGYSMREFCLDGEKMARAHLGYWEEFRYDMIQIENGIAALAEAVGCQVQYPDDEPPWVVQPAIASLAELERLHDIDLRTPAIAALLTATRRLAANIGASVCIRGDSDQGPFSLASQILGQEAFLLALMEPECHEQLHRLLAYAAEQVIRLARAQLEAGSHLTVIGDSIAGPSVCSPAFYREFAARYEKLVIDRVRSEGLEVGIHICGDATRIVSDMVATGTTCLELDFKADRETARETTRGRATVIGTVDPSELLPRGTPSDIRAKAIEDISILAPGGRFVLGAGCTIPRDTPVANVRALVEAALDQGWYAPDGSLVAV